MTLLCNCSGLLRHGVSNASTVWLPRHVVYDTRVQAWTTAGARPASFGVIDGTFLR